MLLLLVARPAGAMWLNGFDDFAADTARRVSLVEAACLRPERDTHPAQFLSSRNLRGAPLDTFEACPDRWRPFDRPRFEQGKTYLLGIQRSQPEPKYEVVERFIAVDRAPWEVRTYDYIQNADVAKRGGWETVLADAARYWDSRGRQSERAAAAEWSAARRDMLIARLLAAMKEVSTRETSMWTSAGKLREIRVPEQPGEIPYEWECVGMELYSHPDSVVRHLAFALWDTTRMESIRRLALELTTRDSSAEVRRWGEGIAPTGVRRLDEILASRLLQDTSAAAVPIARRFLAVARPGDVAEIMALRVLRSDTTGALRAERLRRLSAGETKPLTGMWTGDNWGIAHAWTNAEARSAFDDSSARMRVVATRVLCHRGDSIAIARAIQRVRSRRGPQGQALDPSELERIVEALGFSTRRDALSFLAHLSIRKDALGTIALHGIADTDTPVVRRALRQRARSGIESAGENNGWTEIIALSRFGHREDLSTLHEVAVHSSQDAASEALRGIGQIEGRKAMAMWIERRHHGPPPVDRWRRYIDLEDQLMRQRGR